MGWKSAFKKIGKGALAFAKPAAAVFAPGWVSAAIERYEDLFAGPGTGKQKAAAFEADVQAELLPQLEKLTGKNFDTPEIKAALNAGRDAEVAARNAVAKFEAAKEAIEDAITAVMLGSADGKA